MNSAVAHHPVLNANPAIPRASGSTIPCATPTSIADVERCADRVAVDRYSGTIPLAQQNGPGHPSPTEPGPTWCDRGLQPPKAPPGPGNASMARR